VLLLFGTPFNRLFLLYVPTLTLASAAMIGLLVSLDVSAAATRLVRTASAPARPVAGYLGVVAALNALAWLRLIVPELGSDAPAFLQGTGLITNPVHVQDLALWLPAVGVIAVWLWRHRPWGYLLGGAVLWFWLIESIGVAVDQWFGAGADPGSSVATMAGAYLFAALAVVDAVVLALFLRPRR
jgi:hypothetical protein